MISEVILEYDFSRRMIGNNNFFSYSDAFRLINPNMMVLNQEPRQSTSVLGHLQKPSIQALIHGLNRHYYSISINYRKNELEQKMLMNLNKKSWVDGLTLNDYNNHCQLNKVRSSLFVKF